MSDNTNNNKRDKQPSFLDRRISQNTDISFTSPDDASGAPEATRRVAGPVSFGPPPVLGGPSPFAAAAPSFGGPTVTALPSKQQAAAFSAASSLASQQQGAAIWNLAAVPDLPEFHPLERTAVFVPHSASDPSAISARIAGVLRDRSIEASFDDAKAKAKCTTSEGVDFRVRLYRGRGSYGHGVIAEVQRRFGTSLAFHRDTSAILDAALGKASASAPAAPPPPSSFSSALPLVSDSEVTEDDSEAGGSGAGGSGTSALGVVASMLSHDARDSHYLAFQTLLPLTSAARMGRATARSVSAQLLEPGNPVGSRVLELVLQKPQRRPAAPRPPPAGSRAGMLDDSDSDGDGPGEDEQDAFHLRTLALQVLANAVGATKGQTLSKGLRIELWPVLVREIDSAPAGPRRAQVAAAIAETLLGSDGEGAGDDLLDALERAVEVGRARHAGLRLQAQRCLDKIRRM